MSRTNIVLDDELVAEALALSGVATKREVIHLSLEAFVRRARRQRILRRRAPGTWEGDLPASREDTSR